MNIDLATPLYALASSLAELSHAHFPGFANDKHTPTFKRPLGCLQCHFFDKLRSTLFIPYGINATEVDTAMLEDYALRNLTAC